MHLKTHGASPRLPLTRPRRVLSQTGEITPPRTVVSDLLCDCASAAVIDEHLQVHLGLSAKLIDIPEELPLIGANGFAEGFVVVKDGPETEGKNCGVTETIRNHSRMIYAGLLVERCLWIVLAYHHRKIACWVKENLIATDSKDRFHCNRFTVTF